MLKISRLDPLASAADLSVDDTGVVSVYRKLQPGTEKVYWRANPKENNALVSLDISDGGEVLNFELLTYSGEIAVTEISRPSPSGVEREHIVWVSTEHWHRPEPVRGTANTAWRYVDCDVPVLLSLGKESLCLRLGSGEPQTVVRTSKYLAFGVDRVNQIVAFYVDGLSREMREMFLKRYGAFVRKA